MDVQVGDALADPVIDGDERARGPQPPLDRARQHLDGGEERRDRCRWQVEQRLHMRARHDQRMPGEERPMVEEGHRQCVLVHDVGGGGRR